MPSRLISFTLGLMIITPLGAAPGMHLWYDENGQAVYSQFPPDDGRQSTRIKPPPPPAESPEAARQRLQERLQRLEDNREDKALAREKAEKTKAERTLAKERCESARQNLVGFEGRARQLFRNPDGSVSRLTAEEREAKRAEMRKIIEEACK